VKYIDEYRDPDLVRALAERIRDLRYDKPLKIMEICGGHTHAIYQHGLHQLLPDNIELVHGPGCPVCVIPIGRLDDALSMARAPDVIFTTFGDMMRVPGSKGSLLNARADGADIRFVYSPSDALKIARENPDQRVVFFAIGFETTAPSTAVTLLQAQQEGVSNFFMFCNHVLVIPALKALLAAPDLQLDGFLGPGHVSAIIGMQPYEFIARDHGKSVVLSGFEPVDVLQSVYLIVKQKTEGRSAVENQYSRAIKYEGNLTALKLMDQTMEVRPFFEWRGLGSIPESALKLRSDFSQFDAELRFDVPGLKVEDPKICQCGEVLRGALKPHQCRAFATACTPEAPIGTCMVSSEGACAAYYKYGRTLLTDTMKKWAQ